MISFGASRPSHLRRPPRAAALGLVGALALTACGGGSDDTATTSAPASTSADTTAADTTAPAATAAPADTGATDTAVATAEFDGPAFVDVVDAALAPYMSVIGQPGAAESVAPVLALFTPGLPVPQGATITGAGRTVVEGWTEGFEERQTVAFDLRPDAATLEAFGAAQTGEWTMASIATSGSLATLLLTTPDGRRASFVAETEAASAIRPPLELELTGDLAEVPTPEWTAGLPHLDGGTLVELTEIVGPLSGNIGGATDYVFARWRYPESAYDALNAYLESGVVESAGFTFDRDSFNGFEAMVEVTAGDWIGEVYIGSGFVGDENFYDLFWSLRR